MTYSRAFLHADRLRKGFEGEWANHGWDKGGLTRYGISTPTANRFGLNLATLTEEQAVGVFHEHWWLPIHGTALPWPASLSLYDWCVHSADPEGASFPEKAFQRIVGATPDGQIGLLETVPKALAWCEANGGAKAGAIELAHRLLGEREDFWANGFRDGRFARSDLPLGAPARIVLGLTPIKGFLRRGLRLAREFHTEE